MRRLTCTLLLLCAKPLAGQAPPAQPPAQPPAPLNIHRASAPVVLDGSVDDAAWRDAAVIDRFYETSPADNNGAKVKTTAWVTYDERHFYVGVVCDNPDARRIRTPFVGGMR